VDGEVLQVNIRLGEYATAGVLETPLLLLGNLDRLHLRVDMDVFIEVPSGPPLAAAAAATRGKN
jgi:hypothetical protein